MPALCVLALCVLALCRQQARNTTIRFRVSCGQRLAPDVHSASAVSAKRSHRSDGFELAHRLEVETGERAESVSAPCQRRQKGRIELKRRIAPLSALRDLHAPKKARLDD